MARVEVHGADIEHSATPTEIYDNGGFRTMFPLRAWHWVG